MRIAVADIPGVDKTDLARALSKRLDMPLVHHLHNVYYYAGWLARLIAPKLTGIVELAALYHDVGKIGIPNEILSKAGKPTPSEWEVIKRHPALGAELVEKHVLQRNGSFGMKLEEAKAVCAAILCHHEKWDGRGYPDGLAGSDISLAARIIAVADAYDAMTANRSYRKAMGREEALRQIAEEAGRQFDLDVAACFVNSYSSAGGVRGAVVRRSGKPSESGGRDGEGKKPSPRAAMSVG